MKPDGGLPDADGSVFNSLLRSRPRVEPCLRRLCEGINRRETLRGMVSLGRTAGRTEDFEPLVELFGNRAVSLSGYGDIRLSLEEVFSRMPPSAREAMLIDLFNAVGMSRIQMPLRKREASAQLETLIERFRVAFPDLEPVYRYLQAKQARWIKAVVSEGTEGLQASWFQAAKVTRFLRGNREAMTLADLGARLCGDSKALKSGSLLGRVEEWLAILEGDMAVGGAASGLERDQAGDRSVRLSRYHIVENPGAIKVTLFGPLIYWKAGHRFDFIHDFHRSGEAATLSWENLQGVERIEIEGNGPVLSSENESPFHRLQRERFAGVLVYSQGFPNAAVLRLWELLGAAAPGRDFLHWGDSDLAGLRIASILHAVHPLRLYRCDRKELQAHRPFLKPLSGSEKEAVSRFLESGKDFPFREELAFTRDNGWLEQESWGFFQP